MKNENNLAMISPAKRLHTLRETACILNVSEKSVRRLIDRGLLRSCDALRHVRVPAEAIDEFITNTTKARN